MAGQGFNKSGKSFLDLPAEIRNRIYEYYFIERTPISIQEVYLGEVYRTPCTDSTYPALLLTCKAIESEGTPILYGANTFSLCYGEKFFKGIGSNLKHLRKVVLCSCHGKSGLAKSIDCLQKSKVLEKLVICRRAWGPETAYSMEGLADNLNSLIQTLHKDRTGTVKKQALDVVEFYGTASHIAEGEKLKKEIATKLG